MFAQSVRMGKILGIPFGVNYSWFIIFVLITMSLSTHYANEHPQWTAAEHSSQPQRWVPHQSTLRSQV